VRILFVTHFFPPEELSMAILIRELADAMAERDHAVDVLTGYPTWPSGRCLPGYSQWKPSSERAGALTVHRVPHFASPGGPLWRRMLDFKTFELSVKLFGSRLSRPDLIYVHVPPNEDAIAAAFLARGFGCPCVLNVQDVQPDSALDLGQVQNPLVISLLRRQERSMYRNAAHVVAIGEGLRKRISSKGVPDDRISTLPNWIDARAIVPGDRINALRTEWGISGDRFVVLYAGTFGRIHGTQALLDAAEILQSEPRVLFLLVGQGYDFERNREMARSRQLSNVMIRAFVPRTRVNELHALADVSVVSLRRGFGATSVPSKSLAYMSAGRAVIGLADKGCDTASLIEGADCGVVVEPGNAEALSREVLAFSRDPGLAREKGERARAHVLAHYDGRIVLTRAARLLESIVENASERQSF
jgi:colanic acid biosynthesis glycosyl transferase WcaI